MATQVQKHTNSGKDVAVPSYIKQGGQRGSEHVTTEDITIPRLEVAQGLSPCVKPNDPEYIEGIKVGDIFNTVTRENYGPAVTVCPVLFKKQWLVWRDRKAGGGFRGAYDTAQEAEEARAGAEAPQEWGIVETGTHLVLLLHKDRAPEEVIISLARTKLKVSRNWNTLVRLNGNDRFSRTYVVHTFEDSTPKGEFYNFSVANGSFPDELTYKRAESLYESIAKGERDVTMNVDDIARRPDAAHEDTEF